MRSVTNLQQICDPINIRWVAIENLRISVEISRYFTATLQILIRSQIWTQEVQERIKLHNLCIDHLTIRSELKYLIGTKSVRTG